MQCLFVLHKIEYQLQKLFKFILLYIDVNLILNLWVVI